VRKFAAKLETVLINTPILFWDERLSTVEAQETMTSTKGKHAKTGIDAVAAAHILQSYLRDTQQNHGGEKRQKFCFSFFFFFCLFSCFGFPSITQMGYLLLP